MRRITVDSSERYAAMSFEEIGRRLGITRGGAWMAYRSGMRKLARRPGALDEMMDMAEELDKNRHPEFPEDI